MTISAIPALLPSPRALCRAALFTLALGGFFYAGSGAASPKNPVPENCSTEAAAKQHAECKNVVFHGSRKEMNIALIFDACPRTHVDAFSTEIVDFLRREKIPTTFFVSGKWAEACPKCLRQLESEPFFEIALHGYSHKRSTGLPESEIAGEIENNRTALIRLGAPPQPIFRPPYGDDPYTLAEAARKAGVTPIMWDIGPDDPDPHHGPDYLEKVILTWARGGSIVVMHVNGGGVWTAKALPDIVAQLRAKGFTFVKVSDLLSREQPSGASSTEFASSPASAH